jgi:fructose-1-phosphate kinase PfkB-like protein
MNSEEKIKSRELLKLKFRTKYQTTEFIYKALDVAEQQVEELLKKIEELEKNK